MRIVVGKEEGMTMFISGKKFASVATQAWGVLG